MGSYEVFEPRGLVLHVHVEIERAGFAHILDIACDFQRCRDERRLSGGKKLGDIEISQLEAAGVARGAPTQRYLTRVLRRITFPGAFFLGLVAILPWLVGLIIPFGQSTGLMLVNSSGLLIVVGVVRDMFFNIESFLEKDE